MRPAPPRAARAGHARRASARRAGPRAIAGRAMRRPSTRSIVPGRALGAAAAAPHRPPGAGATASPDIRKSMLAGGNGCGTGRLRSAMARLLSIHSRCAAMNCFDLARPRARRHHHFDARIRIDANRQASRARADADAGRGLSPIRPPALPLGKSQLELGTVPIPAAVRRIAHIRAASVTPSRIARSASSSAASSAPPITCTGLPLRAPAPARAR